MAVVEIHSWLHINNRASTDNARHNLAFIAHYFLGHQHACIFTAADISVGIKADLELCGVCHEYVAISNSLEANSCLSSHSQCNIDACHLRPPISDNIMPQCVDALIIGK